MKKLKWVLLAVIVLAAYFGYNYVYQDHRDIQTEKAEYSTTPQNIQEEFKLNALESEKKYLNKTIEISGTITEINETDLTLNDMIFCQFSNGINQSLKVNTSIIIKGRCIGYDDLLEQVKLDQCSVIE